MKACLNGALNLSVLDGWWAEAFDGTNGWAIDGAVDPDQAVQDQRHADALFDLLEDEVVPLFHERDEQGIPRQWLTLVRASLRTNGPRFSATRMVREYATRIYPRAKETPSCAAASTPSGSTTRARRSRSRQPWGPPHAWLMTSWSQGSR